MCGGVKWESMPNITSSAKGTGNAKGNRHQSFGRTISKKHEIHADKSYFSVISKYRKLTVLESRVGCLQLNFEQPPFTQSDSQPALELHDILQFLE